MTINLTTQNIILIIIGSLIGFYIYRKIKFYALKKQIKKFYEDGMKTSDEYLNWEKLKGKKWNGIIIK